MQTVLPAHYCPNCGREVSTDASRCDDCPAVFEGTDSWKPRPFDHLSRTVRREAARRVDKATRSGRPADPRDVRASVIAVLFLLFALFQTGVLGLFSVMSAENVLQWLVLTVLPTGTAPVVYFLTKYGMAPDSKRAYLGIAAAVITFFCSWTIVIGGIGAWRALVAIGVPENARWPGYLLLAVLLAVQILIFRHFRGRLAEDMRANQEEP